MHTQRKLLAAMAAVAIATPALAAISAEEVKALGNNLTVIGAEKAANKEGTIPAYTGGLTTPPAGYKAGDGIRPNPFAAEKPRVVIDAKNMAQYSGQLTEGTKALLQKYPTFRVDVYPTQRTVAFPKWVADNTAKVAVKAKTLNDGRAIEGAHAGFPFPIPKTGYEVMWNHLVRFNGQAYEAKYRNLTVDASGRTTLATEGVSVQEFPFWDSSKTSAETYWRIKLTYTGPARRAGEALLLIDPLDIGTKDRRAWSYLPGQRRTKVAPDLSHDTPNPGTAGATTFDDTFIFNGSMDRFDFKLVGKKEMYVPYNDYQAVYLSKQDDLLKPNHLNPDLVRWEMHRVWVVEATLKEGKRHVYSKRTFFLDEDSWTALASDEYDARGQLYRSSFAFQSYSYDVQAPFGDTFVIYDFNSGAYNITGLFGTYGGLKYMTELPRDTAWTADALAGNGLR